MYYPRSRGTRKEKGGGIWILWGVYGPESAVVCGWLAGWLAGWLLPCKKKICDPGYGLLPGPGARSGAWEQVWALFVLVSWRTMSTILLSLQG